MLVILKNKRRELWRDLLSLCVHMAWVIHRDFNTFLNVEDKIGYDRVAIEPCEEFNNCVEQLGMEEMRSSGCFFSWYNQWNEDSWIKVRLDRVLAKSKWYERFPGSKAFLPEARVFDHNPLVVSWSDGFVRGKGAFTFLNQWTAHPDFLNIFPETWSSEVDGCTMFQVASKLRIMKSCFRDLHRFSASNITNRVDEAMMKVKHLQMALSVQFSNINREAMHRRGFEVEEAFVSWGTALQSAS
ncbi:hypothetical protein Droror1_Dr00000043 [Drosera rotundifolia]